MPGSDGGASVSKADGDATMKWLADCRRVPSPNCSPRPVGMDIDLIVIHAISLPPGVFGTDCVERLFTNTLDPRRHRLLADLEGVRVSAHLFINRDGQATQFVPFHQAAWHAGISEWRGRTRCNEFSIGIELEGCDAAPFRDAQYDTLRTVLGQIHAGWPGTRGQVTGHQHIAPGRKTDPGPCFDWQRLSDGT